MGIAWDAAEDEGREVLGTARSADLAWFGLRARVGAAAIVVPLQVRALVAAFALLGGMALSTSLLLIAAWHPPIPGGTASFPSPLASCGPVIYALWLLSGLALVLGREALVRTALLLTFIATVFTAVFATQLGLRRPALYVLLALLLLNVLPSGLQPVVRTAHHTRILLVGAAVAVGGLSGLISRHATTWPWPSRFYEGNELVLSGIANAILSMLAVIALVAAGSHRGRRSVVAACCISAGPWAVLAARGVHTGEPGAHGLIIMVLMCWFAGVLAAVGYWSRRSRIPKAA